MDRTESALAAIEAQVDFELIEVAATLHALTVASSVAEQRTEQAAQHCAACLIEIRRQLGRPRLEPVLIDRLRAGLAAARHELESLRAESVAARAREEAARDSLASLRHRATGLRRVIDRLVAARLASAVSTEDQQRDALWLISPGGDAACS